ncbi:hypothetical protein [Lysobacter capsici]|uniref:hypothetical protein n=1 Tax=Lysobacter capsici TaxID=435897 RepID=UPI00398CC6C6
MARPAPAPPSRSPCAIGANPAAAGVSPICNNTVPAIGPLTATIKAGANNCSNILAPRFIEHVSPSAPASRTWSDLIC